MVGKPLAPTSTDCGGARLVGAYVAVDFDANDRNTKSLS